MHNEPGGRRNIWAGSWVMIVGAVCALVILLVAVLWAPVMGPWIQQRKGLANLRQAELERQIQVEQARAEKEAAQLRAEAIAIVGRAAQEFPEYRAQEFIGAFAEALREGTIGQIIYVPTEANIPLMEAGRTPGLLTGPD